MKNTLITLSLIGFMAASPACSEASSSDTPSVQGEQQQTLKIGHVNAVEANQMITARPDITVLDVRTPREYTAGHIDGAINIDYRASEFATQLQSLDPNKEYLIHCASGGRSTSSLKTFKRLGFNNVIHLDGGIKAWNRAGLPTVK